MRRSEVRSEEWRRKVLGTIGGSNAAAAVGLSRFKSRAQLWAEMHALLAQGKLPPEKPLTDDMRRGMVLEPIAREGLAQTLGVSVAAHPQDQFLTRSDYPWAHVLPDAWIAEQPVQIKCPRPGTIARVNMEGLLPEWRVECLHTAAVCAVPFVHFAMFDAIAARVHHCRVPCDEDSVTRLMEQEAEFWQSLQRGEPPPEAPAVEEDTDRSPVILRLDSPEAIEAADAYLRLRDVRDDATDAMARVKDKLVELSQDAEVFVVEGVGKFVHRRREGARMLDREKALADLKRLIEAAGGSFREDDYLKRAAPSRPFTVYPLR